MIPNEVPLPGRPGQAWQREFDKLDWAPWPGPRPIPTEFREHVLGRDTFGEAFLAAVTDHLLVVLTADSGVGKSSLLNGKLLPGLINDGFLPVIIPQWHLEGDESPDRFVARVVSREIADATRDEALDPFDGRFWSWVHSRYGDRLVLILDQFEELIRFQAGSFRRTCKWIAELNKTTKVRVVISLRSEYHHQLRTLERVARPFTMTTVRLEPISDRTSIAEIVQGPTGALIGKTEAELVVELWERASESERPPGLLHLQALLYVLYYSAEQRGSITVTDIEILRKSALALVDDDIPQQLVGPAAAAAAFDWALQEAVSKKLEHCRQAALDSGYDRVLVDGTDALVHAIVPHLSSGGFKLVLDEWTVAQRVLASSLGPSKISNTELRQLGAEVAEYCLDVDGVPTEEPWPITLPETGQRIHLTCVSTLGNGDEWTYHHDDWVPWEHDPQDLSSGPMFGMAYRDVATQELRRFAFAMSWLEVASLVRRSLPVPGRRIVALIHDGFGPALERGYGTSADTFAHSMARLTGARGEEFQWTTKSIDDYRRESTIGPLRGGLRMLNVRWRDCTLRDVTLADAVFVNGDFRGTRFKDCTFSGVTFVNCLLDNTSFVGCHIVGGGDVDLFQGRSVSELKALVATSTAEGDRRVPDFRVDVHPSELAMVERYRRCAPSGGDEVYSRTSGIAAHAVPAGAPNGIEWTPASGGLAVFGGRLSSLMFSQCIFRPPAEHETASGATPTDGLLALRHIAGAALDLVEHRGGRIEIFDSVIRGLSVTSQDDSVRAAAGSGSLDGGDGDAAVQGEEIQLDVLTAIMAGTWFDAHVRGTVRFRDCILTQLVSLAPAGQLTIETDLKEHDDISVGAIAADTALVDAFRSAAPGATPPWPAFEAMDYRSQPARAELVRSPD